MIRRGGQVQVGVGIGEVILPALFSRHGEEAGRTEKKTQRNLPNVN